MIGGLSAVVADVIPMGMVIGERANLDGLNLIGLKRAGVNKDHINGLRSAFKMIFQSNNNVKDTIEPALDAYKGNPLVEEMISFIKSETSRSLTISSKD